ncbi:MAG: amidohydrolase family protein [Gemmatimonadetes bacterium]|nr:amidohydrolase family protein [Gemmatimonadota bacterium]
MTPCYEQPFQRRACVWRVLLTVGLAATVTTSCSGADQIAGDLVLSVGQVVTLDSTAAGVAGALGASEAATVTTVVIANGRVVAMGDSSLISDFGSGSSVLRFAGAVLTPALIDHHVHLFNVGLALLNDRDAGRLMVDVSGAKSLDEVAALIGARIRSLPATAETSAAGAWIVGGGWSQAVWGTQALPSNEVLTAAAPDNPVYLARTDGHAGWLNARALSLAGITAATPNPYGGTIGRNRFGVPNGILLERFSHRLVPRIARMEVVSGIEGGEHATRLGRVARRGLEVDHAVKLVAGPGAG